MVCCCAILLSITIDRISRTLFGRNKEDLGIGYDNKRAIHAILLDADHPSAGLNWRVAWVAAAGFFTDSYNLFASNVVLPALTYVYWDTPVQGRQSGFNVATLLGSILGMITFGIAVDIWGRRSLYGLELVIVIISTLGLLQCSPGFRDSFSGETTWSITPWLFCWRVVMGIGIGAEYPLSACIAAEWSSKQSRARMMSLVFAMQPLGQLSAYIVGYIAITNLSSSKVDIDKFWRIVIGVGTIPTLIALLARPFLPESWRFTYFVVRNERKAEVALSDVYGTRSNARAMRAADKEAAVANAAVIANRPTALAEADNDDAAAEANHQRMNGNGHAIPPVAEQDPVQMVDRIQSEMSDSISWQPGDQFRDYKFWYFLKDSVNYKKLLGTSICWFLLDFAFYGMGFNSPSTLAKLWSERDLTFPPGAPWWQANSLVANITVPGFPPVTDGLAPNGTVPDWTITPVIKSNILNAIYTTQIAALLGSVVFFFTPTSLNRRKMLIGTFMAVGVILVAIAGSFQALFHDGAHGSSVVPGGHIILIVLWAIAVFFFNFGPNTLTFILPAEIFPTRYRCTCYGIAAFAGKLGAVIVQAVIWGTKNDPNNYTSTQGLMAGFAVVMFAGGLVAWIPGLIPDVQDGTEPKALEELSDDSEFVPQQSYDEPERRSAEPINGRQQRHDVAYRDRASAAQVAEPLNHTTALSH